jgi:uncharacterized protein YkwD
MHPALIAFAALAFLISACAPGGGPTGRGQISPGDANAIRLRHLDVVNAVRAQENLAPLQLSAELNAAAETHARDMAVQGRAWHFGSDLTSPRERAFRAGYRGEIVGENISEGTDTDLEVLRTWLGFADTRGVIMSPNARGVGLGWYRDSTGKDWWVQVVGQ